MMRSGGDIVERFFIFAWLPVYFDFVTRSDDSIAESVGYVVGDSNADVVFDVTVTTVSCAVGTAVFVVKLTVGTEFVTENVSVCEN